MKHILILGAGLMQRPAIIAGKKLGFHTVAVDANPKAMCASLADDFEHIDLKDKDGIASLALKLKHKEGLAAVFTAGTDFSASVAYAARKSDVPGHSFEACLNASIKTRMRECFRQAGIPSPCFFDVEKNNVANILSKLQDKDFPMVIKPVDNMGARGCRMIRCMQEASTSIKVAIDNSRTGHAILEGYVDGDEYSIDSLVYDDSMTITGFADRHICYPPYFIEMGHTMPTAIGRQKYLELISAFALGVKALGLTRGAAKADIKYTKDGPIIGEIAARLSGGYMSGWTYPYASGCNLTEEAVKISSALCPEYLEKNRVPLPFVSPKGYRDKVMPFKMYDLPCNMTSAERAWISIPGKVKKIYGYDKAATMQHVKDIFPRISENCKAVFPRNNVEKCGNVITVASTRKKAISAAETAIKNIIIRLEPHQQETEDFLNSVENDFERGFPPAAFKNADFNEDEFFNQTIPQNTSIIPFMPDKWLMSTETNWNYNTMKETAEQFDRLCPNHKEMTACRFWKWFVRGGIQGALYAADTL